MSGKILIVEDDANMHKMLGEILQKKGYQVEGCHSGKEFQDYLNQGKGTDLKLVILDRILGDMDGADIVPMFLEKTGRKIPVLILSSLSTEKDVLEGLQKGAYEYVTKPFSMNIFIEKLERLVGKSG